VVEGCVDGDEERLKIKFKLRKSRPITSICYIRIWSNPHAAAESAIKGTNLSFPEPGPALITHTGDTPGENSASSVGVPRAKAFIHDVLQITNCYGVTTWMSG